MPTYKLYYFAIKGRAEGARLMFAYAGVPYQNIIVTREEWPQMKPKMPNQQLPVLEVDGEIFSQSNAIDAYLSETFGLNGSSAMDRLRINMMIGNCLDVWKEWPFYETDEELRARQENVMLDEKFPSLLEKIEADIVARTTKDYFLDQISLADLFLMQLVYFLDKKRPGLVKSCAPKLKALVEIVQEIPNIKSYADKNW